MVYGAASTVTLKSREVVANESMTITSGAFKTTPVSSMQVMNSEPPQELRTELLLKYFFKSKCHPQSPAHGCVINNFLCNYFNSRGMKT